LKGGGSCRASAITGPGESGDGAVCVTSGYWQRDTRTCGLRQLPLCTACAAARRSEAHQRPGTERAAGLLTRGTA